MGTFQGHALPGSFFILFGVWWTIQVTRRWLVCKTKGVQFYNSASYPCFCTCINLPLEGIVKIVITVIGMVAEGYAATEPYRSGKSNRMGDFHGVYIGDIQHVTMYFMFMLSGIFDIFGHLKCSIIPRGMDYMVSALAIITEGILFKFHLHGRNNLDVAIHTLLLYAIAGCVISFLLEYKYHDSIIAVLSRTFFFFLQGTWFWQAAFILYPPFPSMKHWAGDEHSNIMFVTSIFSWHIAGVICAMSVLAAVTYYMSTRVCAVRKGTAEYKLTGSDVILLSNYKALENRSTDGEESEPDTLNISVDVD